MAKLRAVGERTYHDKHPFHVAMNAGQLSPEALRGWVANRFYYQCNIPIKDRENVPFSNCPQPATSAARGFIESWTTMASPEEKTKAASKPGCVWERHVACPATN